MTVAVPPDRYVRHQNWGARVPAGRRLRPAHHLVHLSKVHQDREGDHSNERESLAVAWALRKYKYLLKDAGFTLHTDNKTLTWL